MSSRAWMPFQITEYLADTGHLTATEHGAFQLLLMHYWQNDGLPSDERMLARIGKLNAAQWAESGFIILDLLSAERDGFTAVQRATGQVPKKLQRPAIPVDVKRKVFQRDGYRCRYCGTYEASFEVDHMLPWSRGGTHALENLTIACAPCNRSKGALTAEEFAGPIQ